jgi:cobalt/nickel transport system permease protein
MIAMTSVVGVQALVFQDGGLAALGANVFNMAVVACLVGYAVHTGFIRFSHLAPWMRHAAAFAAAWLSVEMAAMACSFELALSDTSPLNLALPAMVGVHAAIGVGEGLITVAAVAFVTATRPDLVAAQVPVMED